MRVRIVDCLPQWITSSDTAAYHPYTRTIWIARPMTVRKVVHELCHWLADILHIRVAHGLLDRTSGWRATKTDR